MWIGVLLMPKIKCVECGKNFTAPYARNPRKTCGPVCKRNRYLRARTRSQLRIRKECTECGRVFFIFRDPKYRKHGKKRLRRTCGDEECVRRRAVERSRRWKKKHPIKNLRNIHNYQRRNPGVCLANTRRYRARMAGITGATLWRDL